MYLLFFFRGGFDMSNVAKVGLTCIVGLACTGCSWAGVLTGFGVAGGLFELVQLLGNLFGVPIAPGV